MSNANIEKVTGIELAKRILAIVENGRDAVFENGQLMAIS